MSQNNELTTLVCLFHHDDQANSALRSLHEAGVPETAISVIGGNKGEKCDVSVLDAMGIPSRDLHHLRDGLNDGGTVIAVEAAGDHSQAVERIFGENKATKIDEAVTQDTLAQSKQSSIPVIEEELNVGKRTVDQGGVRVYRRVVEIPAEASINLREERVFVERNLVDRPATQADLQSQTIELTETAEEAVVGKTAHVVEEVYVGKEAYDRVEHISDTVRRTEVEVEELPATASAGGQLRK